MGGGHALTEQAGRSSSHVCTEVAPWQSLPACRPLPPPPDNAIVSTLPADWGARGIFPSLALLDLSRVRARAGIGATQPFKPFLPGITLLCPLLRSSPAVQNKIFGAVPDAWAARRAFPSLVTLDL